MSDIPRWQTRKHLGFVYIGGKAQNFIDTIQLLINKHLNNDIYVYLDLDDRELDLYYNVPEDDITYNARAKRAEQQRLEKIEQLKCQLKRLENE